MTDKRTQPATLQPGQAEEYFRRATEAWPPADAHPPIDYELHRLMRCPCAAPKEEPADP